jgi:branched-chain amino acid transport system ATP-binding protein
MVPENREIFNEMRVIENLMIGAFVRKNTKNIKADLEKVYNLFPILEKRKKQVGGTLSGGERQMLSIGRALMAKPKLLLLDEPSMGIAPILVETIFNAMNKINIDEECPIFLVEQNARKALAIADYAFVLECGRIALQGPGNELREDINVKKAYLGEE